MALCYITALAELLDGGATPIGASYALADAGTALAQLAAGSIEGKAVLVCESGARSTSVD